MSSKKPILLRLAPFAALAFALVIGAWLAFVRKDEIIPIGHEFLFDDFGFRVEGPALMPMADAQCERKVIELRVGNHAVRVPYALEHHTPKLIDADGREYEPISAIVWGGTAPKVELAPNEWCRQELTFEVPRNTRDLHLKISWGALGDT